jgi:large subunit ribosomal protein L9
MNIILLERLGNLGDLGEEVSVKAGFARNYLIPQGKAVRASAENRSLYEGRRVELEKTSSDLLVAAQARAQELQDLTVTIVVKAGEEGKLYGSVGTQDIADIVSEQRTAVAKSEIRMPEGVIRTLGDFTIDIHLHTDVTVPIQVAVVAE